ncbi:MAG: CAP domain-containing protein, partial [Verrucomicrobiales bacterium]
MVGAAAALGALSFGFSLCFNREPDAPENKQSYGVADRGSAGPAPGINPAPGTPATSKSQQVAPAPAAAPAPEALATREMTDAAPASPTGSAGGGSTAPAEEAPPALTEAQIKRALGFIKSNQPGKRQSAYAGFRALGARERSTYLDVLEEARDHHANELSSRAWDLATGDRVLSNFKDAHDSWVVAREKAKEMAQTNWKDQDAGNYKKMHGEMDRAADKAIDLYARVIRSARQAEGFEPTGLQAFAEALAEIRGEIAWCNDLTPGGELSLLDEISEAGGADDYVTTLKLVGEANQIAAAQDSAEQDNSDCAWAGGAYKEFATTLNGRRVAFGLIPLRLDKMLSKACGDHSADMAANGYFSHTGLTPETKSFGQRAKRAGFTGFATGECIFMGNASPGAAHKAWWYSDGHRLIMYANNPNTLGLGLHGKHWTLNTGKK